MSETGRNDFEEEVADPRLDAKLREIWAKFEKPWILNALRQSLPPTRIETLGCTFVVHPRDNFTEFRMWENGLPPEHEATQAIADRLRGTPAVIVDVGANAGAFGLPVLKAAGPGARALAFEPNPVMQARLRRNIALNDLEVALFECALGDAPGRSRLYFPRNGNLGQGRIDVKYAHKAGTEGVEVEVRTLPDCLSAAGVDRVDFLKVDVEGLEDRVIGPLLQSDAAPHPGLIYFEIAHDRVWQFPLFDLLIDRGYREVAQYGPNSLFEREPQ